MCWKADDVGRVVEGPVEGELAGQRVHAARHLHGPVQGRSVHCRVVGPAARRVCNTQI